MNCRMELGSLSILFCQFRGTEKKWKIVRSKGKRSYKTHTSSQTCCRIRTVKDTSWAKRYLVECILEGIENIEAQLNLLIPWCKSTMSTFGIRIHRSWEIELEKSKGRLLQPSLIDNAMRCPSTDWAQAQVDPNHLVNTTDITGNNPASASPWEGAVTTWKTGGLILSNTSIWIAQCERIQSTSQSHSVQMLDKQCALHSFDDDGDDDMITHVSTSTSTSTCTTITTTTTTVATGWHLCRLSNSYWPGC